MSYLTILLGVLSGDLMLKEYVERRLPLGKEDGIEAGPIRIRLLHNSGIAGGWLPEHTEKITAGTALILAAYAIREALLMRREGMALPKTALALMLGGGLSNWYERLVKGYVTDYMSLSVGPEKLRRLVFNLSDVCILIGGLMLVLSASGPEAEKKSEKSC